MQLGSVLTRFACDMIPVASHITVKTRLQILITIKHVYIYRMLAGYFFLIIMCKLFFFLPFSCKLFFSSLLLASLFVFQNLLASYFLTIMWASPQGIKWSAPNRLNTCGNIWSWKWKTAAKSIYLGNINVCMGIFCCAVHHSLYLGFSPDSE